MRQRIAISGSAGVGKSTLARRVAEEYGVPYLPEGMREYLEGGGTELHSLGHMGLRNLVFRLWGERQEREAACTRGFVADRSSYDFAAFWLYYHFAEEDDLTERIMQEAREPGRYDRIFLLPWGAFPITRDGVRSTNRWTQLHLQSVIEGMVRRSGTPVVEVIEEGVEARLAFVRGVLAG